jgi:hypothetical protein
MLFLGHQEAEWNVLPTCPVGCELIERHDFYVRLYPFPKRPEMSLALAGFPVDYAQVGQFIAVIRESNEMPLETLRDWWK